MSDAVNNISPDINAPVEIEGSFLRFFTSDYLTLLTTANHLE
jgi:hypothetical protein